MGKTRNEIEGAIENYAKARQRLRKYGKDAGASEKKWFSGNDNLVGDIGEYWAAKLLGEVDLAEKSNDPYDFKVTRSRTPNFRKYEGEKIYVKAMTPWATRKAGSAVKGIKARKWNFFCAIKLDDKLLPVEYAIVPIGEFNHRDGQQFRWGWVSKLVKPYPGDLVPNRRES